MSVDRGLFCGNSCADHLYPALQEHVCVDCMSTLHLYDMCSNRKGALVPRPMPPSPAQTRKTLEELVGAGQENYAHNLLSIYERMKFLDKRVNDLEKTVGCTLDDGERVQRALKDTSTGMVREGYSFGADWEERIKDMQAKTKSLQAETKVLESDSATASALTESAHDWVPKSSIPPTSDPAPAGSSTVDLLTAAISDQLNSPGSSVSPRPKAPFGERELQELENNPSINQKAVAVIRAGYVSAQEYGLTGTLLPKGFKWDSLFDNKYGEEVRLSAEDASSDKENNTAEAENGGGTEKKDLSTESEDGDSETGPLCCACAAMSSSEPVSVSDPDISSSTATATKSSAMFTNGYGASDNVKANLPSGSKPKSNTDVVSKSLNKSDVKSVTEPEATSLSVTVPAPKSKNESGLKSETKSAPPKSKSKKKKKSKAKVSKEADKASENGVLHGDSRDETSVLKTLDSDSSIHQETLTKLQADEKEAEFGLGGPCMPGEFDTKSLHKLEKASSNDSENRKDVPMTDVSRENGLHCDEAFAAAEREGSSESERAEAQSQETVEEIEASLKASAKAIEAMQADMAESVLGATEAVVYGDVQSGDSSSDEYLSGEESVNKPGHLEVAAGKISKAGSDVPSESAGDSLTATAARSASNSPVESISSPLIATELAFRSSSASATAECDSSSATAVSVTAGSATAESTTAKSTTAKSTTTKSDLSSATAKSATAESATTKSDPSSASAESATAESATAESGTAESATAKSATAESATTESATAESTTAESAALNGDVLVSTSLTSSTTQSNNHTVSASKSSEDALSESSSMTTLLDGIEKATWAEPLLTPGGHQVVPIEQYREEMALARSDQSTAHTNTSGHRCSHLKHENSTLSEASLAVSSAIAAPESVPAISLPPTLPQFTHRSHGVLPDGHVTRVSLVIGSPPNQLVLAGSLRGMWQVKKNGSMKPFLRDPVRAACVSVDNRLLYVVGDEIRIYVLSGGKRRPKQSRRVHVEGAENMCSANATKGGLLAIADLNAQRITLHQSNGDLITILNQNVLINEMVMFPYNVAWSTGAVEIYVNYFKRVCCCKGDRNTIVCIHLGEGTDAIKWQTDSTDLASIVSCGSLVYGFHAHTEKMSVFSGETGKLLASVECPGFPRAVVEKGGGVVEIISFQEKKEDPLAVALRE